MDSWRSRTCVARLLLEGALYLGTVRLKMVGGMTAWVALPIVTLGRAPLKVYDRTDDVR